MAVDCSSNGGIDVDAGVGVLIKVLPVVQVVELVEVMFVMVVLVIVGLGGGRQYRFYHQFTQRGCWQIVMIMQWSWCWGYFNWR